MWCFPFFGLMILMSNWMRHFFFVICTCKLLFERFFLKPFYWLVNLLVSALMMIRQIHHLNWCVWSPEKLFQLLKWFELFFNEWARIFEHSLSLSLSPPPSSPTCPPVHPSPPTLFFCINSHARHLFFFIFFSSTTPSICFVPILNGRVHSCK